MGGDLEEGAHRDVVAQEELARILSDLSIDEVTEGEDGERSAQKAVDTLMRIADLAREHEHRRALGSQLSIVKRVAKILKFSSQKRDSDAAAAPPPTTDALRLKLLEQALRVVANVVAEVDSNRLLFLDKTSALEILVNILRDFGDNSTILRNCCGAIANIACDNHKVCTALQKLDAHLEVLKLIHSIVSSAPDGEISSDDMRSVLSLALRALSNLCHSQVIQRDLVGKGEALQVFKAICEKRDDSFTEQALQLVTDLGGDQQAAVLESGFNQLIFDMISELLGNMESGDDHDDDQISLLESALEFVEKSFKYTSPRNAALPKMVLPVFRTLAVTTVAKSAAFTKVTATALNGLIQLTSDKSLHKRLLDLQDAEPTLLVPIVQAIQQVNNLQESSTSLDPVKAAVETSTRGVAILSNICTSEEQCEKLLTVPSLFEALCELAKRPLATLPYEKELLGGYLQLRGLAMGVLRGMSMPLKNKRAMVQRGVLSTIFAVFSSPIDPRQTARGGKFVGNLLLQAVVAARHLTTKCAENMEDVSGFSEIVVRRSLQTDSGDAGETAQSNASDPSGDTDADAEATATATTSDDGQAAATDALETKENQTFVDVLRSLSTRADGNMPLDFEIGRCFAVWSSHGECSDRLVSSPKCVQLITALLTSEHEILYRSGVDALANLFRSSGNAKKVFDADNGALDSLFKLLVRPTDDMTLLTKVLTLLDTCLREVGTASLGAEKRKELFDDISTKFHELIANLENEDSDASRKTAAQSLRDFEKSHYSSS